MKRLVIAIDFDDVIVDLISVILRRYNEKYGTNVRLSDYYNPDPAPWKTNNLGDASDRFQALILEHHAELMLNEGAVATITKLAKRHELHLVTGRRDELIVATKEFINEHLPGRFTTMEFTNFFDAAKSRTKGEVCKQLGADILIDDHLDHLRSVQSIGLKEVILYGNYPWNQGKLPNGIVRCNDWVAVAAEVDHIARQ